MQTRLVLQNGDKSSWMCMDHVYLYVSSISFLSLSLQKRTDYILFDGIILYFVTYNEMSRNSGIWVCDSSRTGQLPAQRDIPQELFPHMSTGIMAAAAQTEKRQAVSEESLTLWYGESSPSCQLSVQQKQAETLRNIFWVIAALMIWKCLAYFRNAFFFWCLLVFFFNDLVLWIPERFC